MRLTHAVLVLADISGYTDFITNREVSLLYEIAQTLGSSLSLPDTLEFLLKRIAEVVPYTTGTVYLQRDRLLEAVFATGSDARLLSAGRLQPGSGIAGWVFERQQ